MMAGTFHRFRERRRDHRRRMQVERDRRMLAELENGVEHRLERERHLIQELWRLEKALQRVEK